VTGSAVDRLRLLRTGFRQARAKLLTGFVYLGQAFDSLQLVTGSAVDRLSIT
jgi:hypothetical protein